jgi:hypothetical protein
MIFRGIDGIDSLQGLDDLDRWKKERIRAFTKTSG